MPILLDTTAFSDLMREHPVLVARVARVPVNERVRICTITRGEILHGLTRLPRGKRRNDLQAKAERLFARFSCHPVPQDAADAYARIKLAREKKGIALNENDLWIASTAVTMGATLVTRDNDFRRIEGLIVEDWTT